MRGDRDPAAEIVRLLNQGEVEFAWVLATDAPRPPTEELGLQASFWTPTPVAAYIAGSALVEFDRAFRWAVRSANLRVPVTTLRDERRRAAPAQEGLELVEVEIGSWYLHLDPSGELTRVFMSEPFVIVSGIATALGLTGWAVKVTRRLRRPKFPAQKQIEAPETDIAVPPPPDNVEAPSLFGSVDVRIGKIEINIHASPPSRSHDSD